MIKGIQLAEMRKANGITATELARRVGKSKEWVNNIEHERNRIFYEDMVKVLDVLGMKIYIAKSLDDEIAKLEYIIKKFNELEYVDGKFHVACELEELLYNIKKKNA